MGPGYRPRRIERMVIPARPEEPARLQPCFSMRTAPWNLPYTDPRTTPKHWRRSTHTLASHSSLRRRMRLSSFSSARETVYFSILVVSLGIIRIIPILYFLLILGGAGLIHNFLLLPWGGPFLLLCEGLQLHSSVRSSRVEDCTLKRADVGSEEDSSSRLAWRSSSLLIRVGLAGLYVLPWLLAVHQWPVLPFRILVWTGLALGFVSLLTAYAARAWNEDLDETGEACKRADPTQTR